MKANTEENENQVPEFKACVVVSPEGKIDMTQIEGFTKLMKNAETSKPVKLVLDLSHVDLIASVGLRQIMQSAKNAKDENREFVICGPSGIVKEVLEISGFYKIITIYESLDTAMHS